MTIVFILLGAVPATLLIVSKLGLSNPPQVIEVQQIAPVKRVRTSREDVRLAA